MSVKKNVDVYQYYAIDGDSLRQLVGPQLMVFDSVVERYDINMSVVAEVLDEKDSKLLGLSDVEFADMVYDELETAYVNLQMAFRDVTKIGTSRLKLEIKSVDDSYCSTNVVGWFWSVTGSHTLTPAGKHHYGLLKPVCVIEREYT